MSITTRRLAASISAVVLAAVLTGCGADDDAGGGGQGAEETTQGSGYGSTATDDTEGTDDTDDQAAGDVAITIVDFEYELPESVEPGATITVTNEDDVGHTVTSDEEGIFDVVVGPGETVDFTAPEEAGEYPFHCTPHPQMTSTLVVG
ncbi:cupredoxin domain-containing protein [Georgenia deserti]|uniref:Cupredoxin domain-containing protein n=1 Tax=Georgenia deserti TaxID=2093781 RepID=A0ABW4KYA1_9MICO